MNKRQIQPKELISSAAFSQAIEVCSIHSILCIGGQNAIDKEGNVVGENDFRLQCEQALTNL